VDVLLGGRGARRRLARWETRPFWPAAEHGPDARSRRDRFRREVGREQPGPPAAGGPFRLAAEAILRYRVFPPSLIRPVLLRSPVDVGDTVGILYRAAGPVRLFFAARVIDRFDGLLGGVARAGFTYRTLVGHPELGEETFSVEKDLATGVVSVELASWSRPGTRLARAGAPVMRHLQVRANHRALDHLASVASGT
jgi:uncharacterized protein (UPF0548 family)